MGVPGGFFEVPQGLCVCRYPGQPVLSLTQCDATLPSRSGTFACQGNFKKPSIVASRAAVYKSLSDGERNAAADQHVALSGEMNKGPRGNNASSIEE